VAPACDLIRGIPAGKVLADRAYDADSLHDLIYEQGGEPVIPPRRHRKYQHRYDRIAYKQRWASKASSPSSSNGGASPHATTSSPQTSSASSSSPASCFGLSD
jgi:transposase